MILYINTTSHDEIIIALRDSAKIIAQKKINAPRRQAEKLMPAIDRLLKEKKIKLTSLKKIIVANQGGSFTALRIGVITANALAYALQIPVEAEPKTDKKNKKFGRYTIVEPLYDREPTIGESKKFKL
ncbi:MAG: tRNA (adenosine(37)-N6)-threonylcarbamoyltransferase complex dimerization subunit type 1 TsaB [Patescibacteria group bacterium]|jgi:tRNA threonylcarbamoyladenosine biosynthesis protein TsaB